jgi:hypothetical protein
MSTFLTVSGSGALKSPGQGRIGADPLPGVGRMEERYGDSACRNGGRWKLCGCLPSCDSPGGCRVALDSVIICFDGVFDYVSEILEAKINLAICQRSRRGKEPTVIYTAAGILKAWAHFAGRLFPVVSLVIG